MDEQELASFWDKKVPDYAKHIQEDPESRAVLRASANIIRLLSEVDFAHIDTALDWGCGGGWGAKVLAERCDVVLLDVARSALQAAQQLIKPVASYELTSMDSLKISQKIDLILCTTVIYHFPSYAYWKKVAAFWRQLEPEWIAIHTIVGNERKEASEEGYWRAHMRGLILTLDDVIDEFKPDYPLQYFVKDEGKFIFRRR